MNTATFSLEHVSDDQILVRVKELARDERRTTALLIAHLGEVERRDLHLREGFSSVFKYCREVLHLSEGAAYRRTNAARLAARFPIVLDKLATGRSTWRGSICWGRT